MADHFLYGTLRHPALRDIVLGQQMAATAALLPDHRVVEVPGDDSPVLVPAPGIMAQGVLVRGLTPQQAARAAFYQAGCRVEPAQVLLPGATMAEAVVAMAPRTPDQPVADWSLEDWAADRADLAVMAAADIMAAFGQREAEAVLRRVPQIRVRAASRIRAREGGPTTLRHCARPGDVREVARREPYANFFSVEEYDLTFRRFDGSRSDPVNRAVFISGDAATVLPYDPLRDRVLLVEQFRPGPHARGDAQPWMLEPVAGRVDPGESPDAAARREAVEEAGVMLGKLLPVAHYYPSPGAKSEFLYTYVGIADLPDGAAGTAGLEEEGEDIRGHLIPFERLMALIASGEAQCGPLILTAFWLAAHRDRLRREAGVPPA